jgi:hypothetical protein
LRSSSSRWRRTCSAAAAAQQTTLMTAPTTVGVLEGLGDRLRPFLMIAPCKNSKTLPFLETGLPYRRQARSPPFPPFWLLLAPCKNSQALPFWCLTDFKDTPPPSRPLSADGKVTVAKVQVGLLGSARQIQRDLERIASRADTESPQGLHYILQGAWPGCLLPCASKQFSLREGCGFGLPPRQAAGRRRGCTTTRKMRRDYSDVGLLGAPVVVLGWSSALSHEPVPPLQFCCRTEMVLALMSIPGYCLYGYDYQGTVSTLLNEPAPPPPPAFSRRAPQRRCWR